MYWRESGVDPIEYFPCCRFNNIQISVPAELVSIVGGICLPPHTQKFLTELRTWVLRVVCYFACPLTYRKAPHRTKNVVFNSDVLLVLWHVVSIFVEPRIWFLIVICFACPLTCRKALYRTKNVAFKSDVFHVPWHVENFLIELRIWFLRVVCFLVHWHVGSSL
jgi:hypothetical protein